MVRMSVCGTEYEGSTPSARLAHSLRVKHTTHNGCNGGSNPSERIFILVEILI